MRRLGRRWWWGRPENGVVIAGDIATQGSFKQLKHLWVAIIVAADHVWRITKPARTNVDVASPASTLAALQRYGK